jgi:mRNA interferase RelE/StbE
VEIFLHKKAKKFLENTDLVTAKRVKAALIGLLETPPVGDIVPLKGRKPFLRLRAGDYRAIFCKEGDIIEIVKIESRGDVYKD